MSFNITMPKLGLTMESGKITKWFKKPGEKIVKNDILFEVESDKSTVEVESEHDGILQHIHCKEGQEAACGTIIAIISDIEDVSLYGTSESTKVTPSINKINISPRARKYARENNVDLNTVLTRSGYNQRIEERDVIAAMQAKNTRKLKITPVARDIAKEHKVDVNNIDTYGSRIKKEDVMKAMKDHPTPAREISFVPVTKTRQIIAQRLSESFSSPHFYLGLSINMQPIINLRQSYNNQGNPEKISLNSILIKLIANTLIKHQFLNASWQGNSIALYQYIDMGIAVSVSDGLVVPVVRCCEQKSILQINTELNSYIQKARDGKLAPADYENATFTLSNLGMYGIENFTAIINPPATAIMAVGKIMDTPVVVDNQIIIRPIMNATVSCDHRVIDGTTAALFLNEIKEVFENPSNICIQ